MTGYTERRDAASPLTPERAKSLARWWAVIGFAGSLASFAYRMALAYDWTEFSWLEGPDLVWMSAFIVALHHMAWRRGYLACAAEDRRLTNSGGT